LALDVCVVAILKRKEAERAIKGTTARTNKDTCHELQKP
jgi:hypothetical protein